MQRLPELALQRFGLGARPGERNGIGDPTTWLLDQIKSQAEPKGFDAFPSSQDVVMKTPDVGDFDAVAKGAYYKAVMADAAKGVGVRMRAAFETDTPFHERLVWFWTNHLSVTMTAKLRITPFAFDYERSAIRPNVTGTFKDLLLASARHPAMGFYLDNATSVGPNSPRGRERGRGLNENYARELLELHTVGAGNYTQKDIIELAKILTGWTVAPPGRFRDETAFLFVENRHEPGTKTFLGTVYEAGEEAGIAAITALARHPATADRIARKFAAHFTSDDPDAGLVADMRGVFTETDGDLAALAKTLVRSDQAWVPKLQKARDPVQYVTACSRALSAPGLLSATHRGQLVTALATLGQKPFEAPSPQGWPDDAASWFGPDQVLDRAEWALALAGQTKREVDVMATAEDLLGELLGETTKSAIAGGASPTEALALLLASPEVMRR